VRSSGGRSSKDVWCSDGYDAIVEIEMRLSDRGSRQFETEARMTW